MQYCSFLKSLSLAAVFVALVFNNAFAEGSYLEELESDAKKYDLAHDDTWFSLLHYARHYLGLINQGEVDDGNFYIGPNGKRDPQAELNATLESFFRTDVSSDEHPQCRFVARYAWLKSRLNFDPKKLVEQRCRRYEEWVQALNPGRITLVFPASYLNNPSSMFGHTLLRIDPKGQKNERLTSYGVNYGANTDEHQGLLFALKGMFGGYGGGFSIAPYYIQVADYSDIENRDIWEYELNFTKEEITKLVAHLWELRGASFDYYFFDENCSYHLLSLLENARPEVRLRKKMPVWVIPVDSIRAVLEADKTAAKPLLNKAVFRASSKKVLDSRFANLTKTEKEIAKDLGEHKEGALSELNDFNDEEKSKVLEAGADLLSYRFNKKPELIETQANYQYQLLNERSKLGVADEKYNIPVPPRPDLGHETNRVSFNLGTENRKSFYELAYRPAYHDLLDYEPGYAKGAQLEFFGFKFRQLEGEQLKLEKLDLLNILSLSPWDEIFKGFSWNVSTGFQRYRFGDDERYLAYNFDVGGGITLEPIDGIKVFALVGPKVFWGEQLEKHFDLGVGPTIGVQFSVSDDLRLLVEGGGGEYFVGSEFRSYKASAELRYAIDKNLAVRALIERSLNFARQEEWDNWATTTTLSIQKFF